MPLADLITLFCSKLVVVFDAHSPLVTKEITIRPKKKTFYFHGEIKDKT